MIKRILVFILFSLSAAIVSKYGLESLEDSIWEEMFNSSTVSFMVDSNLWVREEPPTCTTGGKVYLKESLSFANDSTAFIVRQFYNANDSFFPIRYYLSIISPPVDTLKILTLGRDSIVTKYFTYKQLLENYKRKHNKSNFGS